MIKWIWKLIIGGKWCDHEYETIGVFKNLYGSHKFHLQCKHCGKLKSKWL